MFGYRIDEFLVKYLPSELFAGQASNLFTAGSGFAGYADVQRRRWGRWTRSDRTIGDVLQSEPATHLLFDQSAGGDVGTMRTEVEEFHNRFPCSRAADRCWMSRGWRFQAVRCSSNDCTDQIATGDARHGVSQSDGIASGMPR
jgi:hypothetical protein